jgi:streptomycin 6-kinase
MRQQWDIDIDDVAPRHGYHGIVMPARRGLESCVLKLVWPEERAVDEVRALTAWDGRGAVRLLAFSTDRGALLLERLNAERTLQGLDLYEAAELAGGLLRRLDIPAADGLRTLRELSHNIADSLSGRQRQLGYPVPNEWLDVATDLARELGASAGNRLVHADLHYGNVLAGEREPWLAIDPKPIAGDPEHAVPELLWTRLDEADGEAGLRRLLDVLVNSGELNADLARSWAIVRSVDYWLWGLENRLTEDPTRCQRIVETLVAE